MPRCAVTICPFFKQRPNEDNTGRMCHSFPTKVQQRRAWEDWVKTVNKKPSYTAAASSGVCSAHFTKDCYLPNKRLRKDAIPSIAPQLSGGEFITTGFLPTLDSFADFKYITLPGNIRIDSRQYVPHPEPAEVFCDSSEVLVDQLNSDAVEVCSELSTTNNSFGDPGVLLDVSNIASQHDVKGGSETFVGDTSLEDLRLPQHSEQTLTVVMARFKQAQARIKALKQSLRRAKESKRRSELIIEDLTESNRRLSAACHKLQLEYDKRRGGSCGSDEDVGVSDSDYDFSEGENETPAKSCAT